jgi:hypothetical protein
MKTMFRLKNMLAIAALSVVSCISLAHTRLTSPMARSTSDGLKTGPCGKIARGANPTVWTAGSKVQIEWEETVDHPGRYFLSFSYADDLGFEQNIFDKNLPDMQGQGALPHKYSYILTVPNKTCDACTLQLIQSMEENPASPSYYYSCADIKIVADGSPGATPTPVSTATPRSTATPSSGQTPTPPPTKSGGSENSFSSNGSSGSGLQKPGMGGCGMVSSSNSSDGGGLPPGAMASIAAMLLPALLILALRRRQTIVLYSTVK